jgi:hypothetical protein
MAGSFFLVIAIYFNSSGYVYAPYTRPKLPKYRQTR